MAKKTVTISISVPITVDEELQSIATETNVSKSAIATAILSLTFNWLTAQQKKDILNSMYGKKG